MSNNCVALKSIYVLYFSCVTIFSCVTRTYRNHVLSILPVQTDDEERKSWVQSCRKKYLESVSLGPDHMPQTRSHTDVFSDSDLPSPRGESRNGRETSRHSRTSLVSPHAANRLPQRTLPSGQPHTARASKAYWNKTPHLVISYFSSQYSKLR